MTLQQNCALSTCVPWLPGHILTQEWNKLKSCMLKIWSQLPALFLFSKILPKYKYYPTVQPLSGIAVLFNPDKFKFSPFSFSEENESSSLTLLHKIILGYKQTQTGELESYLQCVDKKNTLLRRSIKSCQGARNCAAWYIISCSFLQWRAQKLSKHSALCDSAHWDVLTVQRLIFRCEP